MFATVSEKGQVTLPKKLRDLMGIQPGARLDSQLVEAGRFAFDLSRAAQTPNRLAGARWRASANH